MTDIESRILQIHKSSNSGDCVAYAMSRDQRVQDNHALLAAQEHAQSEKLPLVVLFNLHQKVGYRAYEHFVFMLKGLEEVSKNLEALNIPLIVTADKSECSFEDTVTSLNPAAIYWDFSPLQSARKRAKLFAKKYDIASFVVDTHNIIPTWIASDHQEFAAHTFRHKVHKQLTTFLVEPNQPVKHPHVLKQKPKSLSFAQAHRLIEHQPKRNISDPVVSGEFVAHELLDEFINDRLANYALKRNDIANDYQSDLSPYLHFGQISSLRVALNVSAAANETPLLFEHAKMAAPGPVPSKQDGMNALFEEMIVRKELSDNFCFYAKNSTSFASMATWALDTLEKHKADIREHVYSFEELNDAKTHDAAWNAAQIELRKYGKTHGYMRMYWAKKILEWTETPEEALAICIELNDSYSYDGGDPNGYVGILWSLAGLHDRPWIERPIFGKIRYMNEAGLRKKFDLDTYILRVGEL